MTATKSNARSRGRQIRGNDLARFWSKTERRGECVLWTAGLDKDGYGKFATGPHGGQKHHRAHRWIYEQLVGPVNAPVLRHSCDTPACVNVEHLIPGSHADNVHDCIARGRSVNQKKHRLSAPRAAAGGSA